MSHITDEESRVPLKEKGYETGEETPFASEDFELHPYFVNAIKDGACASIFVCSLWFLIAGIVLPRVISAIALGVVLGVYFYNLEKNALSDRETQKSETNGVEDFPSDGVESDIHKEPLIFISYSRKDRDYVENLIGALTERGFSVWLDNKIDYGAFWSKVIEERLSTCEAVVLVMTPRSRESHWVMCELNYALEKKKLIFPILLEGNRWLDVASVQTFNVEDSALPSEQFFDAINAGIADSRESTNA